MKVMNRKHQLRRTDCSIGLRALCIRTLTIIAISLSIATHIDIDRAQATDASMTSNPVFGLWTSINDALVSVIRHMDGDWQAAERMQPRQFDNKRPIDVLTEVERLRIEINVLRSRQRLSNVEVYESRTGEITPTVVYLNSIHMLAGTIGLLSSVSPDGEELSPYFLQQSFENRTPSDVFGLVELAERRLAMMR